ncbi:MAG TPA: preprotein translocase subunit SecE [Candidatus Paceibacterota bacterium]
MSKLTDYIKETKTEMSHVSWPTRKQATLYTVLVVIFSVAVSFYLGFFDYIFSLIIKSIVQ